MSALKSAYTDQKTGALPCQTPSRLAVIPVHGAWQGPDTFSVVAVTFPSTSSVPAAPNFSGDMNIIRNIITSALATGNHLVFVMHSDGALPGCQVL